MTCSIKTLSSVTVVMVLAAARGVRPELENSDDTTSADQMAKLHRALT